MSEDSNTKTEIFSVIQKNILDILTKLDPEDIKPDISMQTLGANSIDRVEVIVKSMADLSLKIPLVEFGKVNNIGGLVDLFYEKMLAQGITT